MKKLYNFRLDTKLIEQVDKLPGPRTAHVRDALQLYLQNDLQNDLHAQQENVKTNDLQNDLQKTRSNLHVNVAENHELLEYLCRDNEWLRHRIERFEELFSRLLKHKKNRDIDLEKELSTYRI
jgi:hypothetical protein